MGTDFAPRYEYLYYALTSRYVLQYAGKSSERYPFAMGICLPGNLPHSRDIVMAGLDPAGRKGG